MNTLRSPTITYSSFNLGLHNLAGMPHDEALDAMQAYLEDLKKDRLRQDQEMQTKIAAMPPDFVFYLHAMFDYSLKLLDAEIDWLENFIQRYLRAASINHCWEKM